MKQFYVLLILAGCLLAKNAYSQSDTTQPISTPAYSVGTFYAGLTYASPVGTYRQAYPRANAAGGTVGLLVNPKAGPTPLELGLQVSYLNQGRTINRTHPVTYYNAVKTTHNVIPMHFVARVKPQHQLKFKPYVDGLAGITVFNTRSKIKEDVFDFLSRDYQTVVLTKYNATLISYGLGVGVLFNVKKSMDTFGDIRLTYLQSPFADHVQKGHVSVQRAGFPEYQFTRSETSMLLLQLNISGMLTSM